MRTDFFWVAIALYAYWCLYYGISKGNPGLSVKATIWLTIRSLVPPLDAIVQYFVSLYKNSVAAKLEQEKEKVKEILNPSTSTTTTTVA